MGEKQRGRGAGLEGVIGKTMGVRPEGDHLGGWKIQAYLVQKLRMCSNKLNCDLSWFL